MAALSARAVADQDRTTRPAGRWRSRSLLPEDFQGRIDQFCIDPLASLRCAGDAEWPSTAREVLEGQLADRDDMETRITPWRPDSGGVCPPHVPDTINRLSR